MYNKLWQVVEKQSLHCLPSDPNIRKEWMNFIFNEDPDRVSKNLVLHFTSFYCGFVYKQGTIQCKIFRKIKTKRQCCVNYIGSNNNVLSVTTDCLIWIEYLCVSDLNDSSVHLGCTVKNTQLLANHSSGHLLPSLQSSTPIQTERSDEGG